MEAEFHGSNGSVLHSTIDVCDVVKLKVSACLFELPYLLEKHPRRLLSSRASNEVLIRVNTEFKWSLLSLSLSFSTQWRSYNLQRGTLSLIRELQLTTFVHNTTNGVLLHNLPTQYGAQVLPATRIP